MNHNKAIKDSGKVIRFQFRVTILGHVAKVL